MRYKKGLIFICLIIGLFSIASVCASDVNETVVASDDNNQIELSKNDDLINDEPALDFYQEDTLKSYKNNEILSANQNTFYNLNTIINGNNDTDVYLDGNYTYNRGSDNSLKSGILINRSVTIHGNGYTIDGNGYARIFSVTASNVIFKDIIFVNAYSSNNGGAIIFSNANSCSIFNCSFINTEAPYMYSAGAIYWTGNNGLISGCNFVNNTAGSAGAIYFKGKNNNIFNSTFMNTRARADKGGSIYWIGENGNVSNCSFINSKAPESGGAIYWSGNYGSITNCKFANNFVKTSRSSFITVGGAIYLSGNNVFISNCFFVNNTANTSGAIHCWRSKNSAIFNCSFVNNTANSTSAINLGESDNSRIYNCFFINNIAISDTGGAISWAAYNGYIFNCSFVNNSAQDEGIIYLHSYLTTDSSYSTNNGKVGEYITISNCSFENNTVESSGVIYCRSVDNCFVTNCSFTNNRAKSGGGINWYYSDKGIISNCYFANNTASSGGAINWNAFNYNGIIQNCSFINNTAMSGGAIYSSSDNLHIYNCSFENNNASRFGGAIYSSGHYSSVHNCNFMNNYAQNQGGAIYWYHADDGSFFNCSFINNFALNYGGAIYWYYCANGSVSNCIFLDNSANNGVIYFSNQHPNHSYNFTINNNIFLDNGCYEISFNKTDDTSNIDYNWFGNYGVDYSNAPNIDVASCNNWLFLNTTITNYKVPILSIYDITFNLYVYNSTSKKICEYNNSLKPINLTIAATNGNADKNVVNMGDIVKYTTNNTGKGSITATIGDVPFTVEFDIIKYYDPFLSIKSQELTYGEQIIVNLTYNVSATGKVNITLKGKENYYNFEDIQLNTTIKLTEMINSDEYNITVFYFEEGIFLNATASASLNIIKANSTLSADDIVFDYGSIGSCEVFFTGASGVNAEIINHTEAIVNVKGNLITVSNLNSGNYALKVTTIPDANHNAVTKFVNIIVKKDTSEVDIPDEITNDEGVLSFDLPTDATGTVTITIENKNYTARITEGKVNIDLPNLKNADYPYVITYSGDDKYSSFTKTGIITINQSSIKARDMVINYGNDYDFKATFFDNDGSPLANAYVIFEVNGIEHATKTDSYGFAILKLGLNSGTYVITSVNTRTGETKINNLIINGITTNLILSDVVTVYNGGKDLVVTLKDINGKPLSSVQVSINLNGVKYLTTDKNGQVKLSTNGLVPNTYTATITFAGNNNYAKSTATAKVTVKKSTPKLSATKKTFKKSVKTKKYTVTLEDNQNKVMKNTKVTIRVNKKTYAAKTNAKGKATFKIKKLTKKGKYNVVVTYKGNKYYNKVTKKTKIIVK